MLKTIEKLQKFSHNQYSIDCVIFANIVQTCGNNSNNFGKIITKIITNYYKIWMKSKIWDCKQEIHNYNLKNILNDFFHFPSKPRKF